MSKNLNIKWNSKGFEGILTCAGSKAIIAKKAKEIEDRANVGYAAVVATMAANADGKGGISSGIGEDGGFGTADDKVVFMYGSPRAMSVVYAKDKAARIAESEYKVLSIATMSSGS